MASADSSARTRFGELRRRLPAGGSEPAGQRVALRAGLRERGLGPLGLDLGVLEARPLAAAALRVRQHGRHAAAVLALQPVVQLEALLDHVQPAGLGLERVRVAAQLCAEVLRLEAQGGQPLGQGVELPVRAGDALREALAACQRARPPPAGRRPARSPPPRRPRRPAARRAGAAGIAPPRATPSPPRSDRAPRSPRSRRPAGPGRGRACRPARAARPAPAPARASGRARRPERRAARAAHARRSRRAGRAAPTPG